MNFGNLGEFLEFKQLKKHHTVSGLKPAHDLRARGRKRLVGDGTVAGHMWPAGRPAGQRPGGPDQPRRRPATRGNGARTAHAARVGAGVVTRSTAVRWGLAGGQVLPASTGGVPGWHWAGGVEAGLTLAAARREGAERRRRCRGSGRRRGREGSGERQGGPAARGRGEGGSCGAASDQRGEIAARGRESSAGGDGFPF
jgi:hypothetical protein